MTQDQKDQLYFQELYGCLGCKYVDKKAIGKGKPCCQYGGKLITENDKCLSRKLPDINGMKWSF